MYRMLLVEDEPIVRLALKSLVNWEKYDFDEVLEAANGKKALEIIKNSDDIDIVITDINMPVMNGIELIEESRKLDKDIQFLVLSAYDDYELVRSAFKLGINDYILKTEMDPDKILKMVLTVLEGREKNRQNKNLRLEKEELLRRILSGEFKSEDLKNSVLRLKNSNYICCYMAIDNFTLVEDRYENNDFVELINSVKNAANQIFESINNGEILVISPKEYGIFLSFEDASKDGSIKKLSDILNKIRYALLNFLNIGVTIGVSCFCNEIENIGDLFEEAQKNSRLRFIFGKGKDIFPEHAEELNNIKKNKNSNLTQRIVLEMSKDSGLLKSLDILDEKRCIEEIKNIFSIKELMFEDNLENIYIYYLEIVLMIFQYIMKDEDNNIEDIIGEDLDLYDEITKFETIKEIEQWILELLDKIIDYLGNVKQRESGAVKEAKEFIQKNYGDKISLDMLSKVVGFSKTYFSKVFTEETGDNFITYLTNVRIEEAKKLLINTDMKIYEICEKVGYPNIEHFSRTFKKIVGVSPLQYKNK